MGCVSRWSEPRDIENVISLAIIFLNVSVFVKGIRQGKLRSGKTDLIQCKRGLEKGAFKRQTCFFCYSAILSLQVLCLRGPMLAIPAAIYRSAPGPGPESAPRSAF